MVNFESYSLVSKESLSAKILVKLLQTVKTILFQRVVAKADNSQAIRVPLGSRK